MSFHPHHRPSQSSLSSTLYPLSPALTARLQVSFLFAGLSDASQYTRAVSTIRASPHIAASLTKCSLLQLFILCCLLGVDYLLLPAWTRGGAGAASGKAKMDPETARFYFQVCCKLYRILLCMGVISITCFIVFLSIHSSSFGSIL